jgi:EAL domain-containing protein (putative c-di-GMP-specific phosphodiesterase class I)
MNVPVADPPVSSQRELLARIAREHFAGHELSEPRPGVVVARFHQANLTSAFQPIVRSSDGGVAGHHALIRVNGDGGDSAQPWNVFAQAADDADLVQLDRMCRTVHALNYFPKASAASSLFLNIEQRLLNFVSADHGAYFEAILAKMNVSPGRVTIVMPAGASEDPVTFVRAAISYRIRGYRVLAQLRATTEADLAHLFLADPHYVAIDGLSPSPPSAKVEGDRIDDLARIVTTLSRRGIHTIARRIESVEQAQAARDVGFGFLQGWHFAPASERP